MGWRRQIKRRPRNCPVLYPGALRSCLDGSQPDSKAPKFPQYLDEFRGPGGPHAGVSRFFICPVSTLSLTGTVAACAETNLAVETTKVVTRQDADVTGPYKVGKPYQVKNVWYYPQADYNYNETGSPPGTGRVSTARATANGETL